MKRGMLIALFLTLVVGISVSAAEINPPPAIFMPWGGKLVTEVNISDDDVLGIAKQAIPALADVIKDLNEYAAAQQQSGFMSSMLAAAGEADLHSLSEAIAGITHVRVVVMKYSREIPVEAFLDEFSKGVVKSGPFRRVLMDMAHAPEATAAFMLPDNDGFIGFVYLPDQRTAYATRVVGGINVEEMIKFAGSIMKNVMSQMQMPEEPAEDAGEDSEQE
ncbi:MAG: hypothetical protein ACOX3G_02890 [Armatimonadota bacterium]|jgi:hypothetical protein